MKKLAKNDFGFTLIELLVVISIISFLAALIFASTNRARLRARDARRIGHLNSISKAREQYYLQNNQYAPEVASACDTSRGISASPCSGASGTTWGAGGLAVVAPAFINMLPVDPTNSSTNYYSYEPVVGQTQYAKTCPAGNACAYILSTTLEDATNRYANPGCDPCNPGANYCVSGGGALFNQAAC